MNHTKNGTGWTLAAVLSLAVVGLSVQAQAAKAPPKKSKYPTDAIAEENHAEAVAWFADILAKYDTNKNGKIDDAEKAAMPEGTRNFFETMMGICDLNHDGLVDNTDLATRIADGRKSWKKTERLKRKGHPAEN